jgi:hypothetical protein
VSVPRRFLADEDFRSKILRGLVRRVPELDVLRVQDVGLAGEPDPVVLEWAAQDDRILLTHDASTMPALAYSRVGTGLPMPGVCVVPQALPIGRAIEDLLLIIECSLPEDWEDPVRYLPL